MDPLVNTAMNQYHGKDLDIAADTTAERVALWRALHAQLDAPSLVLEDEVGFQLLSPAAGWRQRGDMHAEFTRPFRASIVARARFIEDLVIEQWQRAGVRQYVILGAGLDSFAQRHPELQDTLQIFEIDRAGPQIWKRERLQELGWGLSPNLHFVAVDFETDHWQSLAVQAGLRADAPAVVSSTGVSMYLTQEATAATLRQMAQLAPASTFVMSFLHPPGMADPDVRPGLDIAARSAAASGTPFISYYLPDEIRQLARQSGFSDVRHVSADELTERYFADRTDGLRPPRHAEDLLLART